MIFPASASASETTFCEQKCLMRACERHDHVTFSRAMNIAAIPSLKAQRWAWCRPSPGRHRRQHGQCSTARAVGSAPAPLPHGTAGQPGVVAQGTTERTLYLVESGNLTVHYGTSSSACGWPSSARARWWARRVFSPPAQCHGAGRAPTRLWNLTAIRFAGSPTTNPAVACAGHGHRRVQAKRAKPPPPRCIHLTVPPGVALAPVRSTLTDKFSASDQVCHCSAWFTRKSKPRHRPQPLRTGAHGKRCHPPCRHSQDQVRRAFAPSAASCSGTAVRDAMVRAGVPSARYSSVLSLDQRGSQFLVMMDLAPEYGGDMDRLGEIETLIAQSSQDALCLRRAGRVLAHQCADRGGWAPRGSRPWQVPAQAACPNSGRAVAASPVVIAPRPAVAQPPHARPHWAADGAGSGAGQQRVRPHRGRRGRGLQTGAG